MSNKDAHAWPEVYFAGLGWVPLEPHRGAAPTSPAAPATRACPRRSTRSRSQARRPPRRPRPVRPPPPAPTRPKGRRCGLSIDSNAVRHAAASGPVRQFLSLGVLVASAPARAHRARSARPHRVPALVAPSPCRRSTRSCSGVGASARTSWPRPASNRNRRRRRSSSRSGTRPPTARVTRDPRSWSSRSSKPLRSSRPTRPRRPMRMKRGRRSTRSTGRSGTRSRRSCVGGAGSTRAAAPVSR